MQETNGTDSTESIESPMRINIPHYGIDLRIILLGLRYELVTQELCFSPKKEFLYDNVIVPTLRRRFKIKPVKNYLVLHYIKDVKIPIIMDGDLLSVKIVDVIVNYLEEKRVNYPKPLPSPIHEHNVH